MIYWGLIQYQLAHDWIHVETLWHLYKAVHLVLRGLTVSQPLDKVMAACIPLN